jgi:hypothetical protein
MSEPKDFLTRWSERKLKPDAAVPAPDAKDSASAPNEKTPDAPPVPAPAFDVSTLPSLESITEHSDIRAFLQRGVPAELTRAALRRVWSADPAIRDFVGLSENSWDFNAPDSIPGFASSLSTGELKHAAAQLLDEFAKEAEKPSPPEHRSESGAFSAESDEPAKLDSLADTSEADEKRVDVAAQRDEPQTPINFPRQVRRHGSALPE